MPADPPDVPSAPSDSVGDSSAALTNLAGVRQALTDLQAGVAAQARRVEACEGRLALISPSAAYWTARCERLEKELHDSSSLVVQLREDLQHETALVKHLRWQVDYHQSRYTLLAVELGHADFSAGPSMGQTGNTSSPTDSALVGRPSSSVSGKQLRQKSSPASVQSLKSLKSGTSSTPSSSVLQSGTSGGTSSPILLGPSDDDPSSNSDLSRDSEVVRAALAKSRSSGRRSTSKGSSVPPPPATSSAGPVSTPSRSLNQAMFGSSGSETKSVSGKKTATTVEGDMSTQDDPYLLPRDTIIPGYMQTKTFSSAEVAPWPVDLVNSLCVSTMSPTDLVDYLDMPGGWFGPPDGHSDRPPKWNSSLVNVPMIKSLLAARPWVSASVPLPSMSFRPVGWFAELAAAYTHFEEDHSQALWEATHCLLISKEQARANSFLASYYNARKKRRGRATRAWRDVVNLIFKGMSAGQCDLDILLDPFFRHLPRPRCVVYWFLGREEGSNPVDLLEAFQVSDSAWPWLTQYRATSEPHPGTLISRIQNKFCPPS